MYHPRWLTWAGISSLAGGLLAILLTLPFAAAYHRAYSGYDPIPIWFQTLQPVLLPLLDFAPRIAVYNTYGRLYDLVYLLLIPGAIALHHLHKPIHSRLERWGFWLTTVGLLASFVGVAGDYWADGAGFFVELIGLLVLSTGATLSGIACLRGRLLPAWVSWLMILCLPGVFLWFLVIGHIPSGPTFAVALAYIAFGCILIFGHLTVPHTKEETAVSDGAVQSAITPNVQQGEPS